LGELLAEQMMKSRWGDISHRAFQIGVILKGIDGLLEIAGGVMLLFNSQPAIRHFVRFLTHDELVEEPHDFFANLLVKIAQHLSLHTQHFAGIYLLVHGLIKAGLVIGLLRRVAWSYPAAILFLLLFIVYQVYRVFHHFSITLVVLSAFDLLIVALIWREWRSARNAMTENAEPLSSLRGQ